jgi:hypothetical protein
MRCSGIECAPANTILSATGRFSRSCRARYTTPTGRAATQFAVDAVTRQRGR